MKRICVFGFLLVFAALVSFAQAPTKVPAQNGVYFAQAQDYDQFGWKSQAIVVVAKGKITKVLWNALPNTGGTDKQTFARAGSYGMKSKSALGLEWHEEADNVCAYIVKTQNIGLKPFSKTGTTDAISGATMEVKPFFELVNAALALPPVAPGMYKKDGWFYAVDNSVDPKAIWKETVLVTVVNGRIVDVLWNAVSSSDKSKKSKVLESMAGRIGMEKQAKNGPWHVQAARVEKAIIDVQDPAKIAVKSNGTTDAISGATLHVNAVALSIQALKSARMDAQ